MSSLWQLKSLPKPLYPFLLLCTVLLSSLFALAHAQPVEEPIADSAAIANTVNMPISEHEPPQVDNVPLSALPSPVQQVESVPVATAAAGPAVASISTTTTIIPIEPEIPEYKRTCFYADAELCSATLQDILFHSNRDVNTCQCRPHPTLANSWYCCNITHMSMISSCSNTSNWMNLHVRNVTLPELELSNSIYQTLQSLAITDGNITSMVGTFSRFSSIKCLNISNNNLTDITLRAFGNMPNLKILDISKNNLTIIPNFNQNQNITVDMSGNNYMLCESIFNSIFRESLKFINQENSFCLLNSTFRWFNSTDSISIKEVVKSRPLNTECPSIPGFGNCTCKKNHMVTTVTGDQSEPTTRIICEVDCSNLGLIELPPKLPENTFVLNVSNNKITSLGKHFHSNPTYQSLVYLVADNNQISSMYDLEGTVFMDHFQRLYLRNNALSSVPEYFLSNVLDNHDVGRNIFLGGNKLQCDCNSAKTLKYWLLEHNRDIPDYNQIQCRNMPQGVMELREMKLCQSPHDWTDYIYYLIATEVILLLALITKVSYDYWVFKTAGYLPWPASKMPKLPCDWLCES